MVARGRSWSLGPACSPSTFMYLSKSCRMGLPTVSLDKGMVLLLKAFLPSLRRSSYFWPFAMNLSIFPSTFGRLAGDSIA